MAGLFGSGRFAGMLGDINQATGLSPRLTGMLGDAALPMGSPPAPGMSPPDPGMFKGPRKINWGGVITDALAGAAGRPGPYMAGIEERRQAESLAQLAEAKRLAGNQDWQSRFDYEQEHKAPPQPHRWESNDGSLMELGPDGPRVAYRDPTPKINYQRVNNPDGTFTMVPIPMSAAAKSQSDLQSDWDAAGGGPTPKASGDFRSSVPLGPVAFDPTPPNRLPGGVMTSGRRTPEGNRLVGGVAGSRHLSGNAVDYDGPDLQRLAAEARERFPGAKVLIHDGHVHVEHNGLRAPYYGARGTTGLREP